MQTDISGALTLSCVPRLAWAAHLGQKLFNLGEERVIIICFIAYVFFLSLLLLGWQTRVVALFAWLLHLAFNTSGVASTYGVHEFTNISLFYCL